MFGADAAQYSFQVRTAHDSKQHGQAKDNDVSQYLFPRFTHPSPWQQIKRIGGEQNVSITEDCIMIAEFSEQEGPRPVVCIH